MGKVMDKLTKKKISNSLKKSHANNNHPGWKHVNIKTRRSRAEEYFYNAIINDSFFNFIEKHNVNRYFLDFALLDFKCDVEIDGIQHFKIQKQIDHDKKRNKYLIKNGWRIYRIPAKLIFLNCELQIQKLKCWLATNEKINDIDIKETLKLYRKQWN